MGKGRLDDFDSAISVEKGQRGKRYFRTLNTDYFSDSLDADMTA